MRAWQPARPAPPAEVHERIAAQGLWQEHGLVFAQPNGKPMDPRRDHLDWHRLLRQAGVPRARLHDARHTAATVMLQMGVPPRVAMGVLGHSQISLTLGTYSHVIPELANDAAERIGQGFWGGDDVEEPSRRVRRTLRRLRRLLRRQLPRRRRPAGRSSRSAARHHRRPVTSHLRRALRRLRHPA